jgi:hypothetical protein
VSFVIVYIFLTGCSSNIEQSKEIDSCCDERVDDIVFNASYSPDISLCSIILQQATSIVPSEFIAGKKQEAERRCFSRLYDLGDPQLFVDVFNQSFFAAGRVYSLLGLYTIDRARFEECKKLLNCRDHVFYFDDCEFSISVSPNEMVKWIEAGSFSKDDVYILESEERERTRRFLSMMNVFGQGTGVDDQTQNHIEFLSEASSVVDWSYSGTCLEWDLWQMSFSALLDKGNPESFSEVFKKSQHVAGQLYALVGMYELDREQYNRLLSKILLSDVSYLFGGDGIIDQNVIHPHEFVEYQVKMRMAGASIPFYIPPSKRAEYQKVWEKKGQKRVKKRVSLRSEN